MEIRKVKPQEARQILQFSGIRKPILGHHRLRNTLLNNKHIFKKIFLICEYVVKSRKYTKGFLKTPKNIVLRKLRLSLP